MIHEYLESIGAVGAENAIYQAELAMRVGMSKEGVKKVVNVERQRDGSLICSNSHGYYMPQKREEIADFAAREDATAESHRRTARPFHEALRVQEGQADLFKDEITKER